MNHKVFAVVSFFVLGMIPFLSGCKASPDSIRVSLQTSAHATSLYGLRKWGKTKPDAAKECATALKTNIQTELLPYLNGAQLHSSAEIAAFLNSSLFKNVDPDLKELIETASIALDAVLPAPAADKYLTKDQISYVVAFIEGLQIGCEEYLGARTYSSIKPSRWINSTNITSKVECNTPEQPKK